MPAKKPLPEFSLDDITSDAEPFVFTFGGERFVMSADPDIKFFEYLSKGAIQQALWVALGEDQYNTLEAVPETLNVTRAKALFEAYRDHIGVDESGKSSRPSGSSMLGTSGR